ncbi:hypothetical protein SDRG_14400 [Saprolegnia diclina VS20]|uniref:Uncharacterized protein n=1 Tax=Saprolegnia diclina (strain VS20) TaxID=1156394 RepID=T0PZY8_SAPDV|nr:hypothetical protein SDRG_14400 [Saprolegnia diclina VS20]EQC27816.1 hypothetical protein SDRG_14400 [Saprolegnia diclina VS20]|eukprot:XP_008618746.1 hypothetical protein SDRG_14400 [Saprolegnia diclina VS20]
MADDGATSRHTPISRLAIMSRGHGLEDDSSSDSDNNNSNSNDDHHGLTKGSDELQLALAPAEPATSDDARPPRNRSLRSKLATALAEIEEQRYLLEAAAANGQLLVEKYFVLEKERDALAARCGHLVRTASLDSDVPHHQPRAVQKCIDLEQRLHAIEREKATCDDAIAKQDHEILFWRNKAMACLKDHANLKEAYMHLEREHETNLSAKIHLSHATKKLQLERDECAIQVRDLTVRVADLAEREGRWVMANDIKQQKIQRLEAIVADLEAAHASSEAARTVLVTRLQAAEQDASFMQCTMNGLKMSLAALEQEYYILLEKTTLAAPNKESEHPTEMTPLLPRKKTPLAPRKSCSPIAWIWDTVCGAISSLVSDIVRFASRSFHAIRD